MCSVLFRKRQKYEALLESNASKTPPVILWNLGLFLISLIILGWSAFGFVGLQNDRKAAWKLLHAECL